MTRFQPLFCGRFHYCHFRSTFFSDLSLGSQHDKKEFVIRIAIHYLIMNGIMLGGGNLFGWIDIHEPSAGYYDGIIRCHYLFHYFLVFVDEGKSRSTKAEPAFKKRNDNES